MNSIWNFLSSQYQGILVGTFSSLLVLMILFGWKNIINFFKKVPKIWYKRSMEKIVKESIKLTNEEMGISLFPEVKLKIVNSEVPPKDLENKIIIFVKKENKPSVYSNIISQTLDKSFLRDSKRHIALPLYDSAKFMIGKSLITHDNILDHLDRFRKEALRYYERKMEDLLSEEQTLELVRKEELIIIKGMFKTVLLLELYALGERLIGRVPNDRCKQESNELVELLYNIARKEEYKKEKGELPPLAYIGDFFKTGVILVKSPEKANLLNHLKAVRTNIERGVLSNYVLGMGKHIKGIKGDFAAWLEQAGTRDYNNEWFIERIIERKLPKFQKREDTLGICCIFRHRLWMP